MPVAIDNDEIKSLFLSTIKVKTLLHFRVKFINKIIFSLIEVMFEIISTFSLINLLICSFCAVYNYSFKNDLRINCVCCDANITLFDITLMSKKED